MATKESITIERERVAVAYDALAEIEELVAMLRRELQRQEDWDAPLVLRGALLRIKALNSIAQSVIGEDVNRPTAEMFAEIRGAQLEEVRHG